MQTAKRLKKELKKKRQGGDTVAHSREVKDRSEFDSIKNQVLKYIEPEHDWYPRITKIERVINPQLEMEFWEAKSQLFDAAREPERKFHGTGEDGVQGICFGDGFRLPALGRNNMFGQGVYFARDGNS